MKNNATAVIEKGSIVIRLDIKSIPEVVKAGVDLMAIDPPFAVKSSRVFAKELLRYLNDEDEEGTTLIHKMFDEAFNAAAEDGADGLKFSEDEE